MKGLIGKLKGLNYKALVIDHGEKIVLGCVAFFAFLAMTPMMTDWGIFPQSPQEIMIKADKIKEAIDSGASWASSKKATPVISYMDRAHQLSHELLGNYGFSISLFVNLYPPKELIKEPNWLPVGDLIATQGVTILGVQPKVDPAQLMAETAPTGPAAKPANEIGEFDIRLPGMAGAPDAAMAPGAAPAINTTIGTSDSLGGTAPGLAFTARGVRFVSVRGVYPVREQLENIRKSLNLNSVQEAYERLEVLDFTLERQTARPGNDPWSGKWEPVDVQLALDVLNESVGLADDPVDPAVTDIAITSPLPPRLQGSWGEHAIHPKVMEFQLTPAEIKRLQIIEETMAKNQKAVEDQLKRQQQSAKKGFAGSQLNTRQMIGSTVSGRNADTASKLVANINGNDAMGGNAVTIEELRKQFTTFGRVFLFRYIDFDVQPGYAYRYRVRLNVKNPNFEQSEELLADKAVSLGPTRDTPWSTPSNPAVISKTNHFYLKEVERDPVEELVSKPRNNKTIASFSLYLWDATRGTMLADVVRTISLGQRLGEKKKTEAYDVVSLSHAPQEMLLGTDAWLVDATGDPKLDLNVHSDLNLSRDIKKAGLLNQALVLDAEGRLQVIDPASQKEQERLQKSRVDQERAAIDKARAARTVAPGTGTEMSGSPSGSETITPRVRANVRQVRNGNATVPPATSSSGPTVAPPAVRPQQR